MPITINTNVASLSAQRYLNKNIAQLNQSLARLSSGSRIISAKDDAAGLQIAGKLTSQIRGNAQAIQNAQDGLSLLDRLETVYGGMLGNLQRIRELNVQYLSDTMGTEQRDAIKQEIFSALDEIDRLEQSTQIDGQTVFSYLTSGYHLASAQMGTKDGVVFIQSYDPLSDYITTHKRKVQAGSSGSATLDMIDLGKAMPKLELKYRLTRDFNDFDDDPFEDNGVHTVQQMARAWMGTVDATLSLLTQQQATVGTLQNQLHSAIDNLSITNENYSAARSRILDVDVAKESANLSRFQVLQQASVSVLSQANQQSTLSLRLLGF